MRAFIALELPTEVKDMLVASSNRLAAQLPPRSVRWVKPAAMHLTLKFLGEIEAATVPTLRQALSAVTQAALPFTLQSGELGVFPNPTRPRVVWVGLAGDRAELAALQQQVEAACVRLGHAPEKRSFSPHLTLGRVRNGIGRPKLRTIGEIVQGFTAPAPQRWEVRQLTLFQSELQPTGAVYTPLVVLPLRSSLG